MSEKGWNRIKYWAVLFNPFIIVVYFAGMKAVAGLCMYGNVKKRLPAIAVCGLIGILWLVLWTVFWFVREKKSGQKISSAKKLFLTVCCVDLLAFTAISGFYGKMIWDSAQPYSGKLSWKLDELQHSRSVKLEHDNIYRDGVEGIFQDLEKKIDFPEELYLLNEFSVRFDREGNIQEIYSFLSGKGRRYLIDYNRRKSGKITVWLSEGSEDEESGKELAPMRVMMKLIEGKEQSIENQVKQLAEVSGEEEFKILYKGYRSFGGSAGLIPLAKDGSVVSAEECLNQELEYEGYEISLYVPDREEIFPMRYMNAWQKVDLPEKEPELPEYKVGVCEREPGNENLYYMLNNAAGWKLRVADAALGSRWYKLEGTSDGGRTWQVIHEDPFAGSMGVAADIKFFDEQFGFLLLSGASESHAELYVTRDGGLTVAEIRLPKESVTDNVPDLEQYQYTTMPVREDNVLKAELRRERYDNSRLLFESEDEGVTWKYSGHITE